MSEFYDENFRSLQHRNALTARVIEHCYELCLGYSQYEEECKIRTMAHAGEREEMMQHLENLTKRVKKLEESWNLDWGKIRAALKREKNV